jgi:hypothetical protein
MSGVAGKSAPVTSSTAGWTVDRRREEAVRVGAGFVAALASSAALAARSTPCCSSSPRQLVDGDWGRGWAPDSAGHGEVAAAGEGGGRPDGASHGRWQRLDDGLAAAAGSAVAVSEEGEHRVGYNCSQIRSK